MEELVKDYYTKCRKWKEKFSKAYFLGLNLVCSNYNLRVLTTYSKRAHQEVIFQALNRP